MALFANLRISASGLTANRLWLDLIANNIANANTTRTANGEPFRRQMALFAPRGNLGGVQVGRVATDPADFPVIYHPGHPDADANGYVRLPNVDPLREMVDMLTASRAYEANLTVFNNSKQMFQNALNIGR